MTTYHTFPVDNLPPPSDVELELEDRRMREDWTRASDAIGAAEERRNQEKRQEKKESAYPNIKRMLEEHSDRRLVVENIAELNEGVLRLEARIEDTCSERTLYEVRWHYEFDELMSVLDLLIEKPSWMREAAIEAEDERDEKDTQRDALR